MAAYDRGDGVCRYLRDNLCDIYKKRPLICNVEKMYERYFKDTMTEEAFIAVNLAACRQLQAGIDKIRRKR
jgi:Fe-S-cluster containining protein